MRQRFGDDWARIAKLSIIEETASGEKTVRVIHPLPAAWRLCWWPAAALTLSYQRHVHVGACLAHRWVC